MKKLLYCISVLISSIFLQACASNQLKDNDRLVEQKDTFPIEWIKVINSADGLESLKGTPLKTRNSKWKCVIEKQIHCTSEKCIEAKPNAWIKIDFQANTYERCKDTRCISNELDYMHSGIYSSFAPKKNHQTFLKVLNDGSQFTEVLAYGLTVVTGFGKCTQF